MTEINVYKQGEVVDKYHLSRTVPAWILEDYCSQIVAQTKSRTICDVGFGRGSTLIPFSEISGVQVSGVDSSSEMHKVVSRELKQRGLDATLIEDDAQAVLGNLRDLDLVHVKAVTHIPKNPYQFLTNIASAVKVGGHFVIGKEFSQPEDNLENIGKYRKEFEEDSVLRDFYETYFQMREGEGKPFVRPLMPAGDYEEAVKHLAQNGFEFDREISTPLWEKELPLANLIEAINHGTFTVFAKGLNKLEMQAHAKAMKSYCLERGYALQEARVYPAQLKASILRRIK